MLEAISAILMAQGLVTSQWQTDTQEQGELVRLFRDYYEGFHRMQLTTEMKAMLNISDTRLERYNINYCSLIIDRMADRLSVDRFEVKGKDTPTPALPQNTGGGAMPDATNTDKNDSPAQEWVDNLLEYNRFDGLQSDIAVAYLRDGMTFIISEYDDLEKQMCLYQELAYDGDVGMIVVYERGNSQKIAAAVKIWYDVPPTPEQKVEGETNVSQYRRVNIYYPDRTDKYYSRDGQSITQIDSTPEEIILNNKAPGVPVTPFYNRGGVSELVNIIPLQDSLNSQLVDLVMAGRLTAFSIVLGVNVNVPKGITPGMTILKNITDANGAVMLPKDLEEAQRMAAYLGAARLERLPVGDLTQIIKGIEMIIDQIGVISSTPLPGQMGGDSSSGEALKQREIGLLGKLNRAQVQIGNAWEDVIWLANAIQFTFGFYYPPVIDQIDTRWKSAEIRNDTDVLALFKLLNDAGYERAALRALGQSSLASYSEDDIDKMMQEKAKDVGNKLIQAAGNAPNFSNLMNFSAVG
jgi:hypothetical protein